MVSDRQPRTFSSAALHLTPAGSVLSVPLERGSNSPMFLSLLSHILRPPHLTHLECACQRSVFVYFFSFFAGYNLSCTQKRHLFQHIPGTFTDSAQRILPSIDGGGLKIMRQPKNFDLEAEPWFSNGSDRYGRAETLCKRLWRQRWGLLTKASLVLTGVSGKRQRPSNVGEVLSDHVEAEWIRKAEISSCLSRPHSSLFLHL